MRRSQLLLVVVAVLAAAWLARSPGRGGGATDGPAGSSAGAVVTRVVDGDTVHVDLGGRDETVRYIGIDTPESVKPDTPVQCFAEAASSANRRLVEGRRVELRFDAERRDRYGRLLAYVYLEPGGRFVNAELVARGYARTLTIAPDVAHADRFAALARSARRRGLGLWRVCR